MRNKFSVKTFLLTLAPRSRFSTPFRGLATDRENYRPFHKPIATINHVRQGSNNPPKVLENIPEGVNKRLNSRASNKECFEEEKRPYQEALRTAGYNFDLVWTKTD